MSSMSFKSGLTSTESMEFIERSPHRPVLPPKSRDRIELCKLLLFLALHRPVRWYGRLYHWILISWILIDCIVFNVYDQYFGDSALRAMVMSDLILFIWLLIEIMVRLAMSESIHEYRGWDGKARYLRDYKFRRSLDVLGIITFVAFIWLQQMTGTFATILRLLHVIQVFQIYRLVLPLLKTMFITIVDQINQLFIALFLGLIMLLFTSTAIYSLGQVVIDEKLSFFDGLWFGYITLTTIGYGDITPATVWGKILICVLAFCGIFIFQLPANIFGTGLALKLREQQLMTTLARVPAIHLIQSIWKCYATHRRSESKSVWYIIRKAKAPQIDSQWKPESNKTSMPTLDEKCVRFLFKIKYLRARSHFKSALQQKSFDESEQQLEILRKVSGLESSLATLKEQCVDLTFNVDSIYTDLKNLTIDLPTNKV